MTSVQYTPDSKYPMPLLVHVDPLLKGGVCVCTLKKNRPGKVGIGSRGYRLQPFRTPWCSTWNLPHGTYDRMEILVEHPST